MILSRRSFLKMAGLTVVAAASASMFTGCAFTSTTEVKLEAVEGQAENDKVKAALEILKNKKTVLWPADAYKDKKSCIANLNTQIAMKGAKNVEVADIEYVEADDTKKTAAYVKATLKESTK